MTYAGFLVRFRARDGVRPRYLMHSIQRRSTQQYIQQNAVVSTILNFNAERYGDMPVIAASPEVQDAVVHQLDAALARLHRAKDALERSLVLLHERKQALITAAVTGEFDVTTARKAAVA